jgi:HEPN domain-containing protein
MSPHEAQARELLDAAQRDFITLRVLLRDIESPLETTLFHAQQALEKGLKAALVQYGIVFRRTHDLLELCEIAGANNIQVPVARELLMRLGPYAVEFRYLGVVAPEVDREDARNAVEQLLSWVEAIIASSALQNI